MRSAEAKSRGYVGAFESWLRMKLTAARVRISASGTGAPTHAMVTIRIVDFSEGSRGFESLERYIVKPTIAEVLFSYRRAAQPSIRRPLGPLVDR